MTETAPTVDMSGRLVGRGHPTWIIAEIGINHEGSVDRCAEMIKAAAAAGTDAIKLQTVDPDENYMPGTESYQLFSKAMLTREETAAMFDLCRSLGVAPFTTAGDFRTLEWVDRLAPVAHKVSSGLMTHLPLIRRIAATGRPILMSTGMAEGGQILESLACARNAGASRIAMLHCVSLYPCAPELLNLAAIAKLEAKSNVPVGFSDHSLGVEAAALSVAAGACIIEKHFTFDSSRPGYDHPISLDARGFAEMVRKVRAAEVMLGDPDRPLTKEEALKARAMHRILVARRAIAAGQVLSEQDVAFKRPNPGLSGLGPAQYEAVLGRRVAAALSENEPITVDALLPA